MATGLLLVWDFPDGRGMSLSFGITLVVGGSAREHSMRIVGRMWKEQEWLSMFRCNALGREQS